MSNSQTGFIPPQLFLRGTIRDLVIIACCWCCAIMLVNPVGDFPLNDDWSYGMTVNRLIEKGIFHPMGWSGMPLISHVLWGTWFCVLFGFSFTVLRISILILSLLGLFSMYVVVRQAHCSRWLTICIVMMMACNPLFFSLSYTFMTDVSFTAFSAFAFFFFLRSLQYETKTSRDLLFGSCLSTVVILCRQNGLFLPLAFGLSLLVKHGVSRRWLFRACVPTIIGLSALLGFQAWLSLTGRIPDVYGDQILRVLYVCKHPWLLLSSVMKNSFTALLYLGLFLLPILLLLPKFQGQNMRLYWGTVLVFMICSIVALLPDRLMPLGDNILIREGIGPLTLRDTYILHLPNIPVLPDVFWLIVTLLSIVGGGIILARILSMIILLGFDIRALRQDDTYIISFFFLSAALIYFLPLAIQGFFDRYLIPLLFILPSAFISWETKKNLSRSTWRTAGAASLLIGYLWFSLTATHDYLNWNRTRWKSLQTLLAHEQVTPSQIDGGFEFNGLYLYDNNYQRSDAKSWWWVIDDAYMLASGEVPGYDILHRYEFTRWMSPHKGSVVVLRRQNILLNNPTHVNQKQDL